MSKKYINNDKKNVKRQKLKTPKYLKQIINDIIMNKVPRRHKIHVLEGTSESTDINRIHAVEGLIQMVFIL